MTSMASGWNGATGQTVVLPVRLDQDQGQGYVKVNLAMAQIVQEIGVSLRVVCNSQYVIRTGHGPRGDLGPAVTSRVVVGSSPE